MPKVWNEMCGLAPNDYMPPDTNSPYMALFNASWWGLKAASPKLRVGGPATMELRDVGTFWKAQRAWGIRADFVSTHAYPTDFCDNQLRQAPDNCFTDVSVSAVKHGAREKRDAATIGFVCWWLRAYKMAMNGQAIWASRRQAPPEVPFLLTEYSAGWQNWKIHDGESTSYAASFVVRTVQLLGGLQNGGMAALSYWTFSMLFEEDNGHITVDCPDANCPQNNEFVRTLRPIVIAQGSGKEAEFCAFLHVSAPLRILK